MSSLSSHHATFHRLETLHRRAISRAAMPCLRARPDASALAPLARGMWLVGSPHHDSNSSYSAFVRCTIRSWDPRQADGARSIHTIAPPARQSSCASVAHQMATPPSHHKTSTKIKVKTTESKPESRRSTVRSASHAIHSITASQPRSREASTLDLRFRAWRTQHSAVT